MSAPPWMAFYPADYFRDTRKLSTEEHGAYLLLLLECWVNGGELRNDPRELAKLAGLSPTRWAGISHNVLSFFIISEGKITHKRLAKEYARASQFIERQTANGRKGGRPPKTHGKPMGSEWVNPDESPRAVVVDVVGEREDLPRDNSLSDSDTDLSREGSVRPTLKVVS